MRLIRHRFTRLSSVPAPLLVIGLLSCLAGAPCAHAAGGAGHSLPITITSVPPEAAFGKLVPGSAGPGSCLLGSRSPNLDKVYNFTGGVTAIGTNWATPTFKITGDYLAPYTFTVPTSITLTKGASTMLLNTLTSDLSGSPPNFTGTIDKVAAVPYHNVRIGGKLNLAANQVEGAYKGTYSVTVVYN